MNMRIYNVIQLYHCRFKILLARMPKSYVANPIDKADSFVFTNISIMYLYNTKKSKCNNFGTPLHYALRLFFVLHYFVSFTSATALYLII